LSLVQSRALLGLEAGQCHGRGASGQRLAQLHVGGRGGGGSEGSAEARALGDPERRARIPNNKCITINLAPADLPKDSGRFDLPIALGILAASGQFDAPQPAPHLERGGTGRRRLAAAAGRVSSSKVVALSNQKKSTTYARGLQSCTG
jgi:magnesium chelatase family protein